jgi:hypothetical protein
MQYRQVEGLSSVALEHRNRPKHSFLADADKLRPAQLESLHDQPHLVYRQLADSALLPAIAAMKARLSATSKATVRPSGDRAAAMLVPR